MPIAGFVRLRKHQFGRQSSFGTPVPATAAYPFKGTPTAELNWTDKDIDSGSIDVIAPPYRAAPDLTASLTDPGLNYNSLPLLLAGIFGKGGSTSVTPSGGGTAKTWAFDPASATVDEYDPMTYEFGDDVLEDWFQFGDGYLESLEITGPEGNGVVTASMGWRFGSVASTGSYDAAVTGTVPTPALNVEIDGVMLYLKDAGLYIASSTAGLAAGQITDALHTFTLRINQETDEKRFANADQSFDVDALGRGARTIELECTFAKTPDTVGPGSEADAWLSDTAVNRWVRITFTSTEFAEGATPYSWTFDMPMRYYTRVEGEIGGNSTVILTGHAFYDPDDLAGVFPTTVVCTKATL